MTVEPTTKDKQITIDVPEERVAEFYAFYGHFLAGFPGRRRGGPHRGGHGRGHMGHRCHSRRDETAAPAEATAPPERPQAETVPEATAS